MKTYIIEQKLAPLANQYRVFDTDQAGNKAALISFAHQKRFAFKEQVSFYTDESKTSLAFGVKAEKVLDVHGKFIVTGADGAPLGALQKVFKASLLRSTWSVLDNAEQVQAIVTEKSMPMAILRRVWGLIPYANDIPFIFKYHFVFLRPGNQEVIADYIKVTRFRDHYRLELQDESLLQKVGWQTVVAQAVFLDALQGR